MGVWVLEDVVGHILVINPGDLSGVRRVPIVCPQCNRRAGLQ